MENWQSVLKEIPEKWLLEEENPSVRYFMMKDILGNGVENSETERAKERIMQRGIVPAILKKQEEQDYLQTFSKFYTNKYEGLVWQLIALAECGATLNIQIREHCEYIFNNSQEISEGGFSQNSSKTKGGGLFSEVIPCLTGNMAWCLIRFGYFEDYRLQNAINWITKNMIFLDGERFAPAVPPYKGYDMCWGRHTCFMGAVKTLKALAEIPEQKRTPEVTKTIKEAAEFMLLHRVYRQSHNLNKAAKPGWLKFGFPLMYQTDMLEILDVLTSLNINDERMKEAVSFVISKQCENGRWLAGNTCASDKMLVPFNKVGEEDKWVTLRALRVIKKFFIQQGQDILT